MAEPTSQSATIRIAQFFRLSGIRGNIPESIWSNYPGLSLSDRPQIIDRATRIAQTSEQVELAGNGGASNHSLTLYPESETVEYRVKVRFTRSDGSISYRTYRNRTSASGGPAGIVEDIESFIGDISRRYGWESYEILFDSLIVWGN